MVTRDAFFHTEGGVIFSAHRNFPEIAHLLDFRQLYRFQKTHYGRWEYFQPIAILYTFTSEKDSDRSESSAR